jgi:hypothetical protein
MSMARDPSMLGALALIIVFTAPEAYAAHPTTSEVERLVKNGTELRKQGKDQQALPLFQRAYDIAPTGRTSAQLGLCEMQLGYILAASDHIAESLRAKDPWVEKYRTVLEESLGLVNRQIAKISVSGSPVGAEVFIDDNVVGRLPLEAPVRVVAGSPKKVEVRSAGYVEGVETVDLQGGGQIHVEFHLAHPGGSLPQRPGQDLASTTRGAPEGTIPSSSWNTRKLVGTVLMAAGVGSLAAGALMLKNASVTCGAPEGAVCNQGERSRISAWSAVGGGAAAAIVGSLLVFSVGGSHVALAPGPRGVFVAATGSL